MKRWHIVILVLIACGVTTYVATRLLVTERERVARAVRRLLSRVESRDASGVCHLLADDYKDSHGLDRPAVRALLTRMFPVLKSLSVQTSNLRIEFEQDEKKSAIVEFDASVVARRRGRADLPPMRWRRRVRLRLRKVDDEWRVFEAEYPLPERMRPRRVEGQWRIFEAGDAVP